MTSKVSQPICAKGKKTDKRLLHSISGILESEKKAGQFHSISRMLDDSPPDVIVLDDENSSPINSTPTTTRRKRKSSSESKSSKRSKNAEGTPIECARTSTLPLRSSPIEFPAVSPSLSPDFKPQPPVKLFLGHLGKNRITLKLMSPQ